MYRYEFLYLSVISVHEVSSEFPLTFNKGDEIKIIENGDISTFKVSHIRYYLTNKELGNTIYVILED